MVKILTVAAIAFVLAAVNGVFMIPILHKLKFGQEIREEGQKWHKAKSGTPTRGGFIFIAAAVAAADDFRLGDTALLLGRAGAVTGLLRVNLLAGARRALGVLPWPRRLLPCRGLLWGGGCTALFQPDTAAKAAPWALCRGAVRGFLPAAALVVVHAGNGSFLSICSQLTAASVPSIFR